MNLSYSCPVRSTGAYIITSTLLSSFVVQHRHLLHTTINISTTSEHLVVNIVVVLITVTSSVNSNNIKPRAILLLLIESVFCLNTTTVLIWTFVLLFCAVVFIQLFVNLFYCSAKIVAFVCGVPVFWIIHRNACR